jgi:hypothetical protein
MDSVAKVCTVDGGRLTVDGLRWTAYGGRLTVDDLRWTTIWFIVGKIHSNSRTIHTNLEVMQNLVFGDRAVPPPSLYHQKGGSKVQNIREETVKLNACTLNHKKPRGNST